MTYSFRFWGLAFCTDITAAKLKGFLHLLVRDSWRRQPEFICPDQERRLLFACLRLPGHVHCDLVEVAVTVQECNDVFALTAASMRLRAAAYGARLGAGSAQNSPAWLLLTIMMKSSKETDAQAKHLLGQFGRREMNMQILGASLAKNWGK